MDGDIVNSCVWYGDATVSMKMGHHHQRKQSVHDLILSPITTQHTTRHLDDALVVHPHITFYYHFIQLFHRRTAILDELYIYECIPLTRFYASQAEQMDSSRTLLDHSVRIKMRLMRLEGCEM